jgi:L-methionine (R)-S-oxide reductase
VPLVIARGRLSAFDASRPEWAGRGDGQDVIIGVLDIDCEQLEGFDDEDRKGLEGIARLLVDACDW